ncbi:MAG: hypothetical protein JNK53_04645, partial [Phycisphaerae bacterium]|nr:hypothetical protein [Phycisphaerae bacterium]
MAGLAMAGVGFADKDDPAGTGADSNPPCPFGMEIPCDQVHRAGGGSGSGSGAEPGVTCACGPGVWVRMLPIFTCQPAQPTAEVNVPVHINGTSWIATREAAAAPGFAEVHVSGYGASHFWRAGSLTRSAAARYSVVTREVWQGLGVPCPRVVSLAATGGGGLLLALSCSAAPGCGASGTTSISGSCSSLGNASAYLDNKKVDGSVAFNEGSSETDIRGKFGVEVDDSSATVEGRISRTDSWSVRGAGNVSGSASYTVRDDRTY